MSICFDTNQTNGVTYELPQPNDRLPWNKKKCGCGKVLYAAQRVCSCGHVFYASRKRIIIKGPKPQPSPIDMIAAASNKTVVPSAPKNRIKSEISGKARIMQLQARISDYLSLIASAQREITGLLMD